MKLKKRDYKRLSEPQSIKHYHEINYLSEPVCFPELILIDFHLNSAASWWPSHVCLRKYWKSNIT